MRINLTEIPDEGQSWEFSDQLKEKKDEKLPESVKRLFGKKPYSLRLRLLPMHSGFQVSGNAEFTHKQLCSQCGEDIDLGHQFRINELLLPKSEFSRADDRTTTGNHSMDYLADGPEVSYFDQKMFDLGEYIHEIVQAQFGPYPSCEDNACPNKDLVLKKINEYSQAFDEQKAPGHPAFGALKDLLKRQ